MSGSSRVCLCVCVCDHPGCVQVQMRASSICYCKCIMPRILGRTDMCCAAVLSDVSWLKQSCGADGGIVTEKERKKQKQKHPSSVFSWCSTVGAEVESGNHLYETPLGKSKWGELEETNAVTRIHSKKHIYILENKFELSSQDFPKYRRLHLPKCEQQCYDNL